MKKILSLILFALTLVSCSTTHRVSYSQSAIDGYVGCTHEELVQRLGAPTETVSDGNDGYILVYVGNKDLFRYDSKYASKAGTLPKAQFYMDKNNVCQKVRVDDTDSIKVTNVGGTIALVLLIMLLFGI